MKHSLKLLSLALLYQTIVFGVATKKPFFTLTITNNTNKQLTLDQSYKATHGDIGYYLISKNIPSGIQTMTFNKTAEFRNRFVQANLKELIIRYGQKILKTIAIKTGGSETVIIEQKDIDSTKKQTTPADQVRKYKNA